MNIPDKISLSLFWLLFIAAVVFSGFYVNIGAGDNDFFSLPTPQKLCAKYGCNATTGISLQRLMLQTHTHLFGMTFLALFSWFALKRNKFLSQHKTTKGILQILPFIATIVGISSWWLCRCHGYFSWFVFFGGMIYTISLVLAAIFNLFSIWNVKKH